MRAGWLVLLALTGAGCGDDVAGSSGVLQGRWRLVALTQGATTTPIADPEQYTATFEAGGRLSVRADCNSCGGTYTAGNGTLSISPLFCTRVACASAPLDTTFVVLLDASEEWSLDGAELVLRSPGGRLRLRR